MFIFIHAGKNLTVKTRKIKYSPTSAKFVNPPCRVEVKLVPLYVQVGVLKARSGFLSRYSGMLTLTLR